jgi:type I restriction enzyme M protein
VRPNARIAEVRSEHLLTQLLEAQGWDVRRPPNGELLRQQEYKDHRHLFDILRGRSKTGAGGDALPEAILVERGTVQPLAVIEAKADIAKLAQAAKEVQGYGQAFVEVGLTPLAIALAGTSEDSFAVNVFKWNGTRWVQVTYDGHPIGWIPNRVDVDRLRVPNDQRELRPSVPAPEVLAAHADEINRLLRESGIKDEFRPAYVGAMMLALWQSKGNIRKDPEHILVDINEACKKAFWKAKKPDLAASLRVDEANDVLASKAQRIVSILIRLNVTVLTAEHDYLGQLYETFFQYTGGNTIGQYFTPRHIARLMADLTEIERSDVTLDPACGTGGFLVAAMNRILERSKLSRVEVVKHVRDHLVGFEKEPVTAALCVANMILRGDGSTGVQRDDSLTSKKYPVGKADVALMNPPFPHRQTDTPPELFIARALDGLHDRGRLAVIVPRSMLAKRDKRGWREQTLRTNTLDAVIVLPDELFAPYASSYTAILLMTKGVPHDPSHHVFFARIQNDGYRLRKGVRRHCEGEQLSLTLRAYRDRETIPGFCIWTELDLAAGWDSGFYVPPKPLSEQEIRAEVRSLLRNRAAFVVSHAPDLIAMKEAVKRGELTPRDYRGMRGFNPATGPTADTVGGYFDIGYGQKALHSKERLVKGPSLIISSSGVDNGCYGFFNFDDVIAPPFVTVPSTGSLAMAHIQEWPCGVTDDCLILTPKIGVAREILYIAAAIVRAERWRFNYGMKVTPARITGFPLPHSPALLNDVSGYIKAMDQIEGLALSQIVEERDVKSAEGELSQSEIGELAATIESTFRQHADKWHAETQHLSSLSKAFDHPSYRTIIEMGEIAIPLILHELEATPDHWFNALTKITGKNIGKNLDFDAAVKAWLDWGREAGYVTDRN